MRYIAHRINSLEDLRKVQACYGVELDLRDFGERLILQHEPFSDGEDFEEYLRAYNHGTIILNVKSEGIEFRVVELLQKYSIQDYFFLDSSFPMIYRLTAEGEKNIALRFSEFEGPDTILSMQGRVKWVWVDCFTRLPIDRKSFDMFKKAGFKLCLTSPDLLGREIDIPIYKKYLSEQHLEFDAICTKFENFGKWRSP